MFKRVFLSKVILASLLVGGLGFIPTVADFDSQNYARAEAAGKILVDNKASAYENFIAGNKLYERKKYDKAVAKYTEAIKLNPNYGEAYYNRILANGELGNYVQVIEDYFTITKTDPKLASPDNEIGEWQKKAIEYYSREIELNPNDKNLWFYRGYAKQNILLSEESILDYDRAIELDPKFEAAWNKRGHVYARLGQFDKALDDLLVPIKLNPDSPLVWFRRALVYNILKKYDLAIDDFNKAIERNPDFALAYNNRGIAYKALGKDAEAEKDFAKARSLGL